MTVAEAINRACDEAEKFDEAYRIARQQEEAASELCTWMDELKAYRETGLTPEEVTALQASNQELKKETMPILQAKIQERLVILPSIKIGDTAFFIIKNRIFEAKVYYMRWEHHRSFGIRGDISAECMGTCVGAPLFDFGKSVFLTREEAEAALKEQEG